MPHLRTTLLVTAMTLCAAPASAGLFEDLYRAIDVFYATPTGSPTSVGPAGGSINGSRFGRLRIVPNELGDGFRLELDRSFGADRLGRPEVFDAGNLELELSGGTQATLEFTRRGIPTVDSTMIVNMLNYSLRGRTGGQDFVLLGQLDVTQAFEANVLGFYALNLNVNNAGSQLIGEGLGVDGARDADFDIGPISIRGNIFFDTLLALATSLGINTDELETVFPSSPIERINDEIENMLRQHEVLGEAVITEWELSPATAWEGQPLGAPAVGGPETIGPAFDPAQAPEPASLVLIGLLGLVALRRR